MKLNKFQKYTLTILLLPIIGLIVAQMTKDYRYSNQSYIYLFGVLICYLSWGTSFLWGLINSIFIIQNNNQNLRNRLIWITLSLLPIIYITLLMFFAFSQESNDIILPDGERISGEYRNQE